MLHHAEMEEDDMAAMAKLLDLVGAHGSARCVSMAAVLNEINMEVAA
jgi:hypothetical protein